MARTTSGYPDGENHYAMDSMQTALLATGPQDFLEETPSMTLPPSLPNMEKEFPMNMMPPGGAPPNGGDIASQLMELIAPVLASPKGQAMAQAVIQQMGGPQALQGMMGGGGGGGDMAAMMMGGGGGGEMPQGMPQQTPQQAPQQAPQQQAPQGMSTEDELSMASDQMGGGGNTQFPGGGAHGGINPDGPTPEEIALLQSKPTPQNMQNFNKLFGPGAAEQVLQGGGGGAPQGPSSYEDDVSGAMDDAGDHEYR